ncbi:fibrillin-2-like [Contarinia nasturtii]|uniref:fibrillin-2-like n=1 Tax=Contarinia nasturtii TaxID=265458 RepID=UPI0012D49051|nr:fibrillin-2-like [Contarinia nasturtii]
MPNICEPRCVGCAHGTCFAPSECLCNPGYNWDASLSECVPVCDGMCHNGKCISPEKCECNAGYIHHATISVCVPHCNETCVNGVCSGANKCECNYGYRFKNGSQTECEPICTDSCKNAKCVSPNVCECENGYEKMDENKPHECHCGQYCVEIDGQCHCLDDDDRLNGDVIRNNMSTICTANTCQNGRCITRHDCECYDGFEKDENSNCVASIEMCIDDPSDCKGDEVKTCNCINGICASNNTCICVNGFKMSEGHSDVCEPACNMNCVNGYCINPDQCECDTGYRWSYNESKSRVCQPICETSCLNGTCIGPNKCQCLDGFKFSAENNFTCEYDPLYQEAQKRQLGQIHWVIPAVIGVVFIVTILIGMTYFNNKRNYDTNKGYDEANVPIAGYVNDDL